MESKFVVEEQFLNALALAYMSYDIGVLPSLIADDIQYSSTWVLSDLHGKEAYLNYLTGKLETMSMNVITQRFTMLYVQGSGKPFLLIADKQVVGFIGFSCDINDDGLVSRLSIMPATFHQLEDKNHHPFDPNQVQPIIQYKHEDTIHHAIVAKDLSKYNQCMETDPMLNDYIQRRLSLEESFLNLLAKYFIDSDLSEIEALLAEDVIYEDSCCDEISIEGKAKVISYLKKSAVKQLPTMTALVHFTLGTYTKFPFLMAKELYLPNGDRYGWQAEATFTEDGKIGKIKCMSYRSIGGDILTAYVTPAFEEKEFMSLLGNNKLSNSDSI